MKDARRAQGPGIFIDSRGTWFQDGIRITHRWTYLANNRNLDVDEDGRLFVDEGAGRVYVECEDAPFVVTMVSREKDGFFLRLNDESVEELDFETLSVSEDNVPYARVRGGKFRARFSRPAYYEFTRHAERDEKGFYIEDRGEKRYIKGI